MRLNFKRISALVASALMLGMTAGIASAANYPAPFVTNGTANVAIVYGSGAALSDSTAAGSIATSLSSFVSGGSSTVNITGENAPLFLGSSPIYLNSSLTAVKGTLTSSNLPTVLATSTFNDGSVSATVTPTLVISTGSGGVNSNNEVVFVKPTGSSDPVDGLSMSTTAGSGLYNITVGFSQAVNFTSSTASGQSLNLFGNNYYASPLSTSTQLVLYKSAQTLTLSQGGSGNTTATATINGVSHTVQLINAGTSSATISVDGTSQSVNVGSSVTINGVSVAVTSVQSSTAGGNTATVLVGANKLVFKNGGTVLQGDNSIPITGTTAYFTGTPTNLTQLVVNVAATTNNDNTVLSGQSFVDPVFGGFQFTYGGLTPSWNSGSSDSVIIGTDGTSTNQITMTPLGGSSASSFDFASNSSSLTSGVYNLTTINGYPLQVYEGSNLTQNSYAIIGSPNENYGYLILVSSVNTGTGAGTSGGDSVSVSNVLDPSKAIGISYSGNYKGLMTMPDGSQYTFTYNGSGSNGWISLKYPTSIESAGQYVLYPTIQAAGNEMVGVYANQTINLANTDGMGNNVSGLLIPKGNGYTPTTVSYNGVANGGSNWTIGSSQLVTGNASLVTTVNVTVGQLKYALTGSATANKTLVQLYQPGTGTLISNPAVVVFEPKSSDTNDNGYYNAIIVPTQSTVSGSTTYVGTGSTAYFTQSTLYGPLPLSSNTKLSEWMDGYGALVKLDTSNSNYNIMTLSIPDSQSTANLYVGAASSTVSSGNLGNVLVTDSQVSTVASKDLVVVGGSCINSAAAALVGGAYCGSAWTAATGIGSGQFLIKGYTSGIPGNSFALLVAGYEAADTTNAANYLTHYTVDTSKAYSGTSGTTANLIVS